MRFFLGRDVGIGLFFFGNRLKKCNKGFNLVSGIGKKVVYLIYI